MTFSFSLLPWLKRRGWIIVLMAGVVTIVVLALGGRTEITHRGEAVLLVPSGASREGPGSAFEANRLAITYVTLIPRDQGIVRHVARSAAVSTTTASRRLTVSTIGDTSLLRISYRGPNRAEVSAALRAASDAVTGVAPVASTIPPGSVVLASISQPSEASSSSSGSIPVGIILGLALGLAVAVTWERADARADRPASLADTVSCPVSSLDELSSRSGVAVLRRWDSLSNGSRTVALLGVRSGQVLLTRNVALQLAVTADSLGPPVTVVSDAEPPEAQDTDGGARLSRRTRKVDPPDHPQRPALRLVPAGAPVHGEGGESVALQSDFTILVVPAETRLTDIRAAVTALRQFGVPVTWAVFVSRRLARALRSKPHPSAAPGDPRDGVRVPPNAWRRAVDTVVLVALSFVLTLFVFEFSLRQALVTVALAVTLYAAMVLIIGGLRRRRSRLENR